MLFLLKILSWNKGQACSLHFIYRKEKGKLSKVNDTGEKTRQAQRKGRAPVSWSGLLIRISVRKRTGMFQYTNSWEATFITSMDPDQLLGQLNILNEFGGHFDMDGVLNDITELVLILLGVITAKCILRRMPSFLGDACWPIERWTVLASETYFWMIEQTSMQT